MVTTQLTQKELLLLTRKHGISIDYRMPKKHILLFVEEALKGNNEKWLPLAKQVLAHDLIIKGLI